MPVSISRGSTPLRLLPRRDNFVSRGQSAFSGLFDAGVQVIVAGRQQRSAGSINLLKDRIL
ncbi:hypothetical protein [Candidatus Electronema sp. PJ]|uniref:hypothetical protein n=1 Tax=Candidatus Electronema sp. PJ TaxID=3401572 RepID=UPI003AA8E351